ncbi:hypothetical protein [Ensifer sp. 4252]|uniref:hypothetical protein n=1 Tax=Ensifer sp. 4252 TaxID=3373915 RepID=UPI003D2312FA
MKRLAICLLMVCLPFAAPLSSSAEESSAAALKSVYEASRNMQGVITFCIKSGYLGTESDGHISALVKMTDTPDVDKSGGNAAEAKGLAGRLVLDGNEVELTSSPLGAEEWCKQTGEALKSQADQLPQ